MRDTYTLTLDQIVNIVGSNEVSCEPVRRASFAQYLPESKYYNLRCTNQDFHLTVGWEKGSNEYKGTLITTNPEDSFIYRLDNETTILTYNYMINIIRMKYDEVEAIKDQRKVDNLNNLLKKY